MTYEETELTTDTGRKRKIWRRVAWGCGIVAALGLVALGGLVWAVSTPALQRRADARDPGALERRAQKYLGTDALPAGYHAAVATSVPFVMQVTILSDRPGAASGLENPQMPSGDEIFKLFDDSGFYYFKTPWFFLNPLEAYHRSMAAEPKEPTSPEETLVEYMREKYRASILAEGEVDAGGGRVAYVNRFEQRTTGTGPRWGLTTDLFIRCGDWQHRSASWMVAEPGRVDENGDVHPPESLAGTPADEQALGEFLDQFDFCR